MSVPDCPSPLMGVSTQELINELTTRFDGLVMFGVIESAARVGGDERDYASALVLHPNDRPWVVNGLFAILDDAVENYVTRVHRRILGMKDDEEEDDD